MSKIEYIMMNKFVLLYRNKIIFTSNSIHMFLYSDLDQEDRELDVGILLQKRNQKFAESFHFDVSHAYVPLIPSFVIL